MELKYLHYGLEGPYDLEQNFWNDIRVQIYEILYAAHACNGVKKLVLGMLLIQVASSLCFYFSPQFRAGSDEIDGQKAGTNGHHAGSPEAAHPAAGPAAAGPGGSQDPSTSHTR